MGAIVNGLSLSKLRPFGATFFIFSDYARPAIRLSALMELPTIFVFTHDAMGDGEDGPTHQPVEHLASLRAIPGLTLLRPGDANEVVEAYRVILQLRHRPAVLVLSRQPLPTLDRSKYAPASGVARGAYVLADTSAARPDVILIATGSEVSLAAQAHEQLVAQGIRSRVVSMPSWDIFEQQPQDYRDSVLPPDVTARVAIEQASTFGWERYVGSAGRVIGMQTFGASAPLKELQKEFGFTVENVVEDRQGSAWPEVIPAHARRAGSAEPSGWRAEREGGGRAPDMYPPSNLNDPSAHALAAGDLEAVLLPGAGMLGASLRHRGVEMLGRVEDLAAAAAKGSTAGVPLLHPWANRLAGLRYRAAGRDVVLDRHRRRSCISTRTDCRYTVCRGRCSPGR